MSKLGFVLVDAYSCPPFLIRRSTLSQQSLNSPSHHFLSSLELFHYSPPFLRQSKKEVLHRFQIPNILEKGRFRGKRGRRAADYRMQKPLIVSIYVLHALVLSLGMLKCVIGEEGFCSDPAAYTDSSSRPLYWKVTNPTLSPVHLQDLPGFTRSVYKRDHAVITPESHVFSPLPDWTNTLGAYLITPAMGSQFVMYLANMQANSKSGLPPKDVERFVFVVQGVVTFTNMSGLVHKLVVDSYAYLPAGFEHSLICDTSATLVVYERRYAYLESFIPEPVVGSTDMQPLLETPGEVFELRKLLPMSAPYDFNIHIMDFQPGEYLNVKEVHYNQHGLLLLEGQGIYRLGDSWYPVQTGDVIWMAPFVPQWYAALGKTRSRYMIYKDVNRNPL